VVFVTLIPPVAALIALIARIVGLISIAMVAIIGWDRRVVEVVDFAKRFTRRRWLVEKLVVTGRYC